MKRLEAHVVRRVASFDLEVSIQIEPGQTVALLGPNGAGKSTTLAAISGSDFDGETAGTNIVLGDRTLEGRTEFVPPDARRIGVVFQDALLFDHLTVLDNGAFSARSRGASRRASRSAARPWLERLDLTELADRGPADLSGGQAQRVAIARALASEPDMLLLDEPLSALDVSTRSEIRRVLREHLDDFAGPRLLVTHDPADAFLLADRLDVIEDGRITQSASADAIRRSPATAYVAALAGTNLFGGEANGGTVQLRDHDHTLTIADTSLSGGVLVTIHPTAISLHPERPSGSQRNVWPTTIDLIEPLGDTVRVTLGAPVPIAVDITPGAVTSLGLTPGSDAWVAVKATEIHAAPS
jgi:molybdate transport system ATP-binding protein